MKTMTAKSVRVCVLGAVIAVFGLGTTTANAKLAYAETYRYYDVSVGFNATIGERHVDCDGQVSTWGVTKGEYEMYVTPCDLG
jgi:hypothetical protein